MQTSEIDVTFVHHVEGARLDGQVVENSHIAVLPWVMRIKQGILPRRSIKRVQLDRPLATTKCAQGNRARHRSIVVESKA